MKDNNMYIVVAVAIISIVGMLVFFMRTPGIAECGNNICEWNIGEDNIVCPRDCFMEVKTIHPTDDAWVNHVSSNGISSFADIAKFSDNRVESQALYRADLSSIPEDSKIVNVILRAYDHYLDCPAYDQSPQLSIHRNYDDSWIETRDPITNHAGVTWTTKPSYNPTPTDTFKVDPEKFDVAFDVTSDIVAEWPSNKIFSWTVVNDEIQPCFVSVSTKDHDHAAADLMISYLVDNPYT